MRFRRTRSGTVRADLAPVEVAVLASVARDLLELLTSEPPAPGADPLEALVGLSSGPVPRPDDPALQRLLPDAYRPDAPGLERDAAEAAAADGVKATIPLIARKGRASYLGERSRDHQDPGATSSHLIIKALADTVNGR